MSAIKRIEWTKEDWLRDSLQVQGLSDKNRETWLRASFEIMNESLFKPLGYDLPETFISTGKTSGKHVRGECYFKRDNSQRYCHVFISVSVTDTKTVLAVLAHELIHSLRPMAGHGKDFKEVANAIGLVGKMTTATPSELLIKYFEENIIALLGDYPTDNFFNPHGGCEKKDGNPGDNGDDSLKPLGGPKKQSTRLKKVECKCGYKFRLAQSWIDKMQNKTCHCCGKEMQVS